MDKIALGMALGLAAIVSLIAASLIPIGVPHVDPAAAWTSMLAEASCTNADCAEEIIRKCDSSSEIAILRGEGKAWLIRMVQAGDNCRVIVGDIEFGHPSASYHCDVSLAELASLQADGFDGIVSKITGRDSCRMAVP